MSDPVREAAQALLDAWDGEMSFPEFDRVPINRLREALAVEPEYEYEYRIILGKKVRRIKAGEWEEISDD